jgi:chromosome partitioning protein
VRSVAAGFEFVLMDCPPSLGGLPTIALSVSDAVLIPIQCEYYAMEGLSQILPVIKKVNASTNKDLKICGLLLTMFSEGLELSHDVVREVVEYFPDLVFRTIVPRDVVLAEAASHGVPAFQYAPLSRGAWSYLELAKEVLADEQS